MSTASKSLLPGPTLFASLAGHDLTRVRFLRRPALTADGLLRRAVSDEAGLLPSRLRAELIVAMGQQGRAAYRLLTGRHGEFCATVVVPDVDDGAQWVAACADELADSDDALLEQALLEAFGDDLSDQWTAVLQNPRPWFRALAVALVRAGPVIDAVWRSGSPRLDAEQARIASVASAAAGVQAFVNSVSDQLAMTECDLQAPYQRDFSMEFTGDVVITPQVGPPAGHLVLDRHDNISVAYGVSPAPQLSARGGSSSTGHITALLGPARAALLLALNGPRTMGELASVTGYAPSTLSHHSQRLQAAGLITATRIGGHVILERTTAAEVLLDLL